MKLLEIIPSLDPATGGPVEGLRQMSRALTKHGHQVEALTLDAPDAPWLAPFPVPTHAVGPSAGWYGYTKRLAPWLLAHARRYDAVIINGIWQYHSFGAWRALRKLSVPYFVYPHGMLDPWFKTKYPLKHAKKWMYWPWADYRVLRDATAVLFTSEEERELARQSFWLYRANERVVNFGIAGVDVSLHAARTAFYKQFPQLHDKRIVLFVSRIHPKKGCDLLLRAFETTRGADSRLHLLLVGPADANARAELETLAREVGVSDHATLGGMVTELVKWGAYAAADVFVLPSHSENFGAVVPEALSCGLPTLISTKVNIWREIDQFRAGLVAPDTLEGTTAMLREWFALTNEQRNTRRTAARSCFEQCFEVSVAAHKLADVVETLARAR
jgi:glycosyltransferase involved in cell wall biosynthesis